MRRRRTPHASSRYRTGARSSDTVASSRSRTATGEIAYHLRRAFWGRGYGTEAARGLLGIGFTDFGFHRIVATVRPENLRSVAVLERLGMRREAHFRRDRWIGDRWADSFVYAITEDEWTDTPPGDAAPPADCPAP